MSHCRGLLSESQSHITVRTSGENIGDSGLIQAYRAWKAQYTTSLQGGNEFLLPGLNYKRKAFWVVIRLLLISFGAGTSYSLLRSGVFGA